jgi:hypothetical protein
MSSYESGVRRPASGMLPAGEPDESRLGVSVLGRRRSADR